MIFDDIPCCKDCIHATVYVPYWSYPFTDPLCEISGCHVNSDDVCCEHFEDCTVIPRKCVICGVNISDLHEDEIYCEYCKNK